jgi:uncharacterized protein DUF397
MDTFRKSSHSTANSQDCVEVANSLCALRDSKNPHGPMLRANVAMLVADIKSGRIAGRN